MLKQGGVLDHRMKYPPTLTHTHTHTHTNTRNIACLFLFLSHGLVNEVELSVKGDNEDRPAVTPETVPQHRRHHRVTVRDVHAVPLPPLLQRDDDLLEVVEGEVDVLALKIMCDIQCEGVRSRKSDFLQVSV